MYFGGCLSSPSMLVMTFITGSGVRDAGPQQLHVVGNKKNWEQERADCRPGLHGKGCQ